MDTIVVDVGDIVDSNTRIGNMGDTGNGEAHLHFEIRSAAGINLAQIDDFRGHPFTGPDVYTRGGLDNFWAFTWEDFQTNWVDMPQLSWIEFDPEVKGLKSNPEDE